MSGTGYLIVAYIIGSGLLWGYALWVWKGLRRFARQRPCTEKQT